MFYTTRGFVWVGEGKVKKTLAYLLIIISLVSMCVVSLPKVSSQTQNVKILSYTYYSDMAGFIDAVGEVQNQGPNYVTPVVVAGSVVDSSGNELASNVAQIGTDIAAVNYLAPGEKAPFYLEFAPPQDATNGWTSEDVAGVNVFIYLANATQSYSYPDVKVTTQSNSIGTNPNGQYADFGAYWVTGTLKNTGSQAAQNVTVFGTFYNSTGSVVAVGSTNTTFLPNLDPSQSASFKLGAFDVNQTNLPVQYKIATYNLLIEPESPVLQTSTPIITPGPTVETSATPTASNSPGSSTNPVTSPSGSQGTSPTTNSKASGPVSSTVIAAIVVAVVIVLVAVGAVFALRSHKPNETTKEKVKRNRR